MVSINYVNILYNYVNQEFREQRHGWGKRYLMWFRREDLGRPAVVIWGFFKLMNGTYQLCLALSSLVIWLKGKSLLGFKCPLEIIFFWIFLDVFFYPVFIWGRRFCLYHRVSNLTLFDDFHLHHSEEIWVLSWVISQIMGSSYIKVSKGYDHPAPTQ